MSDNVYEQAALVLQALRRYGDSPALNRRDGNALADGVDALVASLRRREVGPRELVTLTGDEPVQLMTGVLAAWLAGATPCAGPALPGQRLWLEQGVLRHSRAASASLDAALVVEEALVGAVAHPLVTLGRLSLPARQVRALTIFADWRVDAWLPLACQALLEGVADITLLAAGAGGQMRAVPAGWIAAPLDWLGSQGDAATVAAAATASGVLTWGSGNLVASPAAGRQLHALGDHFILGLISPGRPRGEVLGRHRVCNEAGRVLPDNAWGLLALGGTLPVVAATRDALEAPSDRTWITELRARRRADGSIEFSDAELDPQRHAGRRLSVQLVRQLLADNGLGDAALVALGHGTPQRRLVLYTSDDSGAQRLAAAVPAWAAPLGVTLLPRLARDAAGEIDLAALRGTVPPDRWLLTDAEHTLGVQQGAAVQLRTHTLAVSRPPLPLPPEFLLEGGQYHGGEPALLVGAPQAAPDGDLTDRLRSAAATGNGLLLVDGNGRERAFSYAALLDTAARIAAYLRAQGVEQGQEVIVHCPQPADLFAGIWGCILLGVLPVPLTPASPYDAPSNPLWHLLGPRTMLTCRTILTSQEQQQSTTAALARHGLEATLHLIELASASAPLPASAWTPGSGALMLLTSGSTGAPKGVVLTHGGLLSLSRAVSGAFGFGAVETSLNWLAIDHVGGLVQHHMRDLCLGNQQLHIDTAYVLADPTRMLDLIERHQVSLLWMANFGFNLINEHAARIAAGHWNLASVKLWENGGEAVTHDGCQRFLALLAPHGLAGDVIKPVFGMTETHSACIGAHNLRRGRQDNVHWLSDTALDQPVRRALPGHGSPFVEVGQPFPGTSVRVVDAQGQLCRAGSAGRIEVRGLQLMAGYYRNDQANAETFTADGWLRMGDCGFVVDGSLVVTGREKDIVIVNGLNYSAQALESTVEGIAGVRVGCCAAVAVRQPEDVTDSLVVFYSVQDGGRDHGADRAAIVDGLVAEHGLRPAALVALAADAWPRTAIGKIRRQRLASGFMAGEFADQIVLHGQGQLGERVVLPDWHFTLDWGPATAPVVAARRVLWLGGAAPAGAALSALPGAAFGGFDAAGHASYRLGEPADLSALLAAADECLDGLDMVVDAHWRQAPAADDAQTASAALVTAQSQWSALFTAAELLPDAPAIVLATSAAFVVDGAETGIAHAALPGVAASLGQSRPQLRVVLVDGAAEADLLHERPAAGVAQVAYRGGVRLTPMLRPLTFSHEPATVPLQPRHILRRGGRYLIIGGLGGVGVHLSLHLLRNFGASVLAVGRGSLKQNAPRAQVLAYLAEQAALADGASIAYRQVNPANADALHQAVLAAEQAWGAPPDAVFNLAGEGSVAERLAALNAGEGAESALRSAAERIALLHAVERALAGSSVPVVTFSSVNGWFGGTGFVEYAGACAYQAAYAGWQAQRGARFHLCLDWSMWKQVGMAADVPAAMVALARRRGFDSLTPAQALASLHLALDHGRSRQLIGLYPSAPAVMQLLPPALVRYQVESAGSPSGGQVAAALGIAPELVRCTHGMRQVTSVPAAHAAALLAVFRDVLVRPELDADDNFFANGGDSIRAIQVVSRAADIGLTFSPLDLFEHKTVGALLGHLAQQHGLDGIPLDEVVDDGQPVALPPILSWWLELADQPAMRDHFTMGMRYEIDAGLAPEQVRDALLALIARHDALLLRLHSSDDGSWRLATAPVADAGASLKFAQHRLATNDDCAAQVDAIEHALHRTLDLAAGVLVSATHVERGSGLPALLLLVIHHAAVDGVSWRLLEDELRQLLELQRRPDAAALTPVTAGFADWSRRLAQRARRIDGPALADAWAVKLAQPSGVLPGTDSRRLLEAETAILSRTVPVEALRLLGDASVHEVLLTAVGWSLAEWMGSQAVLLDVEGHGRLNRIMPADLGRVVGWFTSIAPLRLDFSGCDSAADALPQVRSATEALRGNDLEWGMLKYMNVCPVQHPLRHLPQRQISFNYLGSFDSTPQPNGLLAALPGSLSAEQSPLTPRRYVIDIAAQVCNWELELSVKYSPQVHGHAVIERWLDSYESVLRQLLGSSAHPTISASNLLLALGEVAFDVEDA